jgi:hypothetical protein
LYSISASRSDQEDLSPNVESHLEYQQCFYNQEEIAKYASSEVPLLKQLQEEVKCLNHHQERSRTLNKLLSPEKSQRKVENLK